MPVGEYGAIFSALKDKEADRAVRVQSEVDGQPVLMVGRYACARSQLLTAEVPPPVISLARGAFYLSEELVEVVLPDTLKMIGIGAFRDCRSLERVNVPSRVSRVDNSAFRACTSLRTLTLPESVTALGTGVFAECVDLEVWLPEGSVLVEKYPEVFADVKVSYTKRPGNGGTA